MSFHQILILPHSVPIYPNSVNSILILTPKNLNSFTTTSILKLIINSKKDNQFIDFELINLANDKIQGEINLYKLRASMMTLMLLFMLLTNEFDAVINYLVILNA
ncbi:hypothetical protein BpHYR1_005099 [Brachionus plicatilis]|uniref:Uncharacterized protein n=1 Tax=Brachionus plicatilis TaxID=10195 RepID=A0A3M7QYF5_BRAPC|nr:hypothetical protein BpHYR1_005099 [Brachionus plicatilis]